MPRVALRISGVGKSYGKTRVLEDLDLEVFEGELFVLLGPSGCGKTTLLRALAGLLQTDRGRVILLDRDITTVPAEERDIAMVFQDYALYPHMTVRDNLAFGLTRHRVPKEEIPRRIERVTRMLAIDTLLARKPHELSGGQQQRVALGRAIVREPALFLMDEPLSSLDAQVRSTTRAELKELQRRLGVTTVYVTHDQVEAMTLADRLAVLHRGRVEQVGRPLDVYREPATVFVAQFLSSPRLNLLRGELVSNGAGLSVRTGPAVFPLGHTPVATGTSVLVGIRPEGLRLSAEPVPGSLALDVGLIEPLGAEVLLHARCEGLDLVARTAAESSVLDRPHVWIDAAASRIDVFDTEGRRLRGVTGPRPIGGSSAER